MSGIFIVGSPRSGTTLLQSMLAAHSMFYTSPELSFFDRIIPRLGVEYYDPSHIVCKDDLNLIANIIQDRVGISAEHVLQCSSGLTIKQVFHNLIEGYNTNSKPIWVEKTPNHARFMLAIQRFYPNAKFIHIIRDPVDSVASMNHIKPTSIFDNRVSYLSAFYNYAKIWNKCIESAYTYSPQENVLHIRYENLVISNSRELQKICDFLNVGFEEEMLERFTDSAGTIFNDEYTPWQSSNRKSGLNAMAVHKWRRKLTAAQVWIIQNYTNDWACRLGYYNQVSCMDHKKILVLLNEWVKRLLNKTGMERKVRKIIIKWIMS